MVNHTIYEYYHENTLINIFHNYTDIYINSQTKETITPNPIYKGCIMPGIHDFIIRYIDKVKINNSLPYGIIRAINDNHMLTWNIMI